MVHAPEANVIKLFEVNFLNLFCKLGLFRTPTEKWFKIKWSSLCKIATEMICEINSRA